MPSKPTAIVVGVLLIGAAITLLGRFGSTLSPNTAASPPIHQLRLTRDYDNAKLTIRASLKNSGQDEVQLVPPFVELTTGEGVRVPAFFLASAPPQKLAPNRSSNVDLEFWLEASHLAGSLILRLGGEAIEVKNATPFDLDSVRNQQTVVLQNSSWTSLDK